ncbi:MAG: PorT family protein [Bacteroidales bacterium]|nr:PorT family protein [Bacteroidales bacterium]MBQ7819537.1 PorT family protein [Bacteroidales bacterium]
MKKILLIFALALFVGSISQAKADDFYKGASYKLYVGMNGSSFLKINDFYMEPNEDKDIKLGFNAGFRFDYQFNRYTSIQTGIDYAMKGYLSKTPIHENSIKTIKERQALSTHYLSIPILYGFRYDFDTKTPVQLQFNTGPYIAVGVAGKCNITNVEKSDYTYVEGVEKYKVFENHDKEDIHYTGENGYDLWRFDMGWKFELGFNINSVYLGVAYDLGCVDIQNRYWRDYYKEKFGDNYNDYKIKNHSFSLNVGYIF